MAISRHYLNTDMTCWTAQQRIDLPSEVAHHVTNVLRRRIKDEIQLFDGQGCEWRAFITAINRRSIQIELVNSLPTTPESPINTHLGIALFRGDRFDFALQKAVELGINSITPLLTEHVSIKQSAAHIEKRFAHWEGVIIAACEQSKRSHLPKLAPVTSFHDWVEVQQGKKFILHPPQPSDRHQTQWTDTVSSHEKIVFTSGPEGGFSEAELAHAKNSGYIPVSLGGRTLRAETAPLAFLSILQFMFGDFH